MQSFRKVLFWLHLIAGCVAGLIILLMSFTGVLLTYERQIVSWLDAPLPLPAAAEQLPRLPVSALAAAVQKQNPKLSGNVTLTLRSDPSHPAEIRVGREAAIYIDPYSGQILPKVESNTRAVFQKITAWHRWLGVEGAGRPAARAITGACNFSFLFIIVSGAYLWLPRKWSWQSVRAILVFRGGLSGKARDFNWHNVFGIWALLPLFFVVLTALPMSYPWANNLLYTMSRTQPVADPVRAVGGRELSEAHPDVDLDRLWTRAKNQVSGWKTISARLIPGSEIVFTIDAGDGGQPQKRSTLTLYSATGNQDRFESYADVPAGRRLRMWSRFVHTGEYYGIVGQTIAGLSSFAGVMLVWTGISLALRRFSSWRSRRLRPASIEMSQPVNAGPNRI